MSLANKTIIYILGAGRSGTTLLDIVLGNQDGIFSCGELNRYAKQDGFPTLAQEEKQVFWRKIREKILQKNQNKSITYYSSLIDTYEHHFGFLLSLIYRNKKNYKLYSEFTANLYNTIFQSISEEIIIDSSKHPGRLYHIINNNLDVKVIYLVRKPSDVISSFQKKNIEQPAKSKLLATLYYFIINTLCKLTMYFLQKRTNFVKIKFEDLVNKPDVVFAQISDKLNINLEELKNKEHFSVGNLFDGNRIRLQNSLKIKKTN